jgi:hypothetical protein
MLYRLSYALKEEPATYPYRPTRSIELGIPLGLAKLGSFDEQHQAHEQAKDEQRKQGGK